MSTTEDNILASLNKDEKNYFLAILISDGIEHVSKLPAPCVKFTLMDIRKSFISGSSYRSTFSYITLSDKQNFWVSDILAIIYNRNNDIITIYFKNPAKCDFLEVDCIELRKFYETVKIQFSCKGHYISSYDSEYQDSSSLESLFFAFKSLAYCSEDSYSIVALNGGAYIDDYTYNYYDHDMINRLHCIHEPYQGKRS